MKYMNRFLAMLLALSVSMSVWAECDVLTGYKPSNADVALFKTEDVPTLTEVADRQSAMPTAQKQQIITMLDKQVVVNYIGYSNMRAMMSRVLLPQIKRVEIEFLPTYEPYGAQTEYQRVEFLLWEYTDNFRRLSSEGEDKPSEYRRLYSAGYVVYPEEDEDGSSQQAPKVYLTNSLSVPMKAIDHDTDC